MRVFVIGGTGVVGRRLVPLLVATGHDVVASTTAPAKLPLIEQMKAHAVQLDVLDAAATRRAIQDAKPDAIVHQATALSHLSNNFRNMDRIFAKTNQLRTAGTRNLLAAAEEFGVQRIIAQSYCGWPYPREGSWVKTENDPLDTHPLPAATKTIAAIVEQERLISEHGGVVLRYGGLYGPGTSLAPGGPQYQAVRKRLLPVVGDGAGVISFIHVDDAATAALAALTNGAGIYNIVDDEPAAARDWIPYLASAIGAKPPRHVPAWLARVAAGQIPAEMMTHGRGGSNAKAKAELSWRPQYATWREGFKKGLG